MTETVTEIGGLRVAKAEPQGAPEGPPILFVHGMWDGSWIWHNYLGFFPARGHACYALDLRGRAGSRSVPDSALKDFRNASATNCALAATATFTACAASRGLGKTVRSSRRGKKRRMHRAIAIKRNMNLSGSGVLK